MRRYDGAGGNIGPADCKRDPPREMKVQDPKITHTPYHNALRSVSDGRTPNWRR